MTCIFFYHIYCHRGQNQNILHRMIKRSLHMKHHSNRYIRNDCTLIKQMYTISEVFKKYVYLVLP